MDSGKAAGPSGIVAEMLKPVGEAGALEVRDLIEDIIIQAGKLHCQSEQGQRGCSEQRLLQGLVVD